MQRLVDYAQSFIGTPGVWGGDNPYTGFDCSGFVQWVLRMAGFGLYRDTTAQGLYEMHKAHVLSRPEAGALVFYGKDLNNISHVAFCIDDLFIIESGGVTPSINLSIDDAKKNGAGVRQRMYDFRGDLLIIVKPQYSF